MNTLSEFELNRIRNLYSGQSAGRARPDTCTLPGQAAHVATTRSVERLAGAQPSQQHQLVRGDQPYDSSTPFVVDPHRYQRALSRRPKSPSNKFGRALFDFQAKSGRELSVRRGDLVEMLELLDHHWARVEDCQSGLQGLVPLNYIDYSVGCAVAKRDVSGRARVNTGASGEAHLLAMSRSEPIVLIRRLSGHWYEASNTRRNVGLVWSDDLDIIKQPVLAGSRASQPAGSLQAGGPDASPIGAAAAKLDWCKFCTTSNKAHSPPDRPIDYCRHC